MKLTRQQIIGALIVLFLILTAAFIRIGLAR